MTSKKDPGDQHLILDLMRDQNLTEEQATKVVAEWNAEIDQEIDQIEHMSKEEVDARLKDLGIEVDVDAAMKRINEEFLRRLPTKGNA